MTKSTSIRRLSQVSRNICRSTQRVLAPFSESSIITTATIPSYSTSASPSSSPSSSPSGLSHSRTRSISTSPGGSLSQTTTKSSIRTEASFETSSNNKIKHQASTADKMADRAPVDSTSNFPGKTSDTPGEQFEVRQTSSTEDWKPDPSKSIPLSPQRQALVDDIIALYSCKPTVERVKRYTRDCVYDDQFVYANDRYKMAGQWFALPKLFKDSTNEGYEIVKNDRDLIQFKNEQSWTFLGVNKTATINALVSLSLDPGTVDSDFIQVKYHKDQADEHDYSHKGLGFSFKKFQADNVVKYMNSPEVQEFVADKDAAKEEVRKYADGDADAPVKDL